MLIFAEGCSKTDVFLYLRFLFVLVDCLESGMYHVELLSLWEYDELQEEAKQVNLSLFRLADAGNGLHLFEVEQCVDADVVVLLVDCV